MSRGEAGFGPAEMGKTGSAGRGRAGKDVKVDMSDSQGPFQVPRV